MPTYHAVSPTAIFEETQLEEADDEKGNTIIMCNDDKSPQFEGVIMTTEIANPVNESSKQVNASDKIPNSEGQTTQVDTKDDNGAQQTASRLDVDVDVSEKQNRTQKNGEGLGESRKSNMAVSAATIITCSSEIKSMSQKETPATNTSFHDMDIDNTPVIAVNSLHNQSVVLNSVNKFSKEMNVSDRVKERNKCKATICILFAKGQCIMGSSCLFSHINVDTGLVVPDGPHPSNTSSKKRKKPSKDRKLNASNISLTSGPHCDGGIITAETTNRVNESCEQVNASGIVLHSEEQTKNGKKRSANMCRHFAKGWCNRGTACRFSHISVYTGLVIPDKLTNACVKDRYRGPQFPPANSSSRNRKEQSDIWLNVLDMSLSSGPQCDGGIITAGTTNRVNESCEQVNASGIVVHSEVQTTHVNIKDVVNEAQQTESRLDVDAPLIKVKEGNKRSDELSRFFAENPWSSEPFYKLPRMKDATNVVNKQNATLKSDAVISEGTRSNMGVSAASTFTCTSEIEPVSQNETPPSNSLVNNMDKDNPYVSAVNSLHDQSVIPPGITAMISNDEKSLQCGGIMTGETTNPVNESCEQGNASDKVPHSEVQTTHVIAKDVNESQQTESRLDIEVGNKQNKMQKGDEASAATFITCSSEIKATLPKEAPATISSFNDMDKDIPSAITDILPHDQSLILVEKTTIMSNDDKSLQCDDGITTLETMKPVNESSKQVHVSYKIPPKTKTTKSRSRMPVSDRAMGSVTELIKCYDKKVVTEKRLRERIKRYSARLKKLKRSRRSMSEKGKEALRTMAEKEVEHKKEVYDLMQKLENAYKENVQLQRVNVGMVIHLQGKTNQVNELKRKASVLEHANQVSAEKA